MQIFLDKMKKSAQIIVLLGAAVLAGSCNSYNKVVKSYNNELKYETAKRSYVEGNYSRAASLLKDVLMFMKLTPNAEESLYLLGMTYFNQGDYVTSSHYFKTYYTTFPRGQFTENARYMASKSLYLDSPEARLDQSGTYMAIQELQMFMEYFPESKYKDEAQKMQFELQDKLVYKDFLAAKLYYDLGDYMGNNYEACIVTAQNALKDYPYTNMREELSILILRSRYQMALHSIDEKRIERYRETIDEYYAFKNEFPETKYEKEISSIFRNSEKYIKD